MEFSNLAQDLLANAKARLDEVSKQQTESDVQLDERTFVKRTLVAALQTWEDSKEHTAIYLIGGGVLRVKKEINEVRKLLKLC